MLPSTGTVGDSYDNAMAESVNGAYKTELVWRRKPFQDLRDLELATFRWVSWWNSKRLHQSLGYRTPERTETEYYANQAAQAAPTIRAEQKSGHIRLATMRGNASLLRHQSSSPFMICANTVWKLGFGVAPYTPLR